MVKLAKDDFAGLPELRWQKQRGIRSHLVGVVPNDPIEILTEASQIVEGKQIVGRITSSRFSPSLSRSIAMALVADSHSRPGTNLTVLLPDGRHVEAKIAERRIHFDPKGIRLRG